jgi:hypothetical protein
MQTLNKNIPFDENVTKIIIKSKNTQLWCIKQKQVEIPRSNIYTISSYNKGTVPRYLSGTFVA